VGEELSYYAVTDGERVVALAAAQDHKRALDGDLGENTGGMGACSPAPILDEAVEKRVQEEIVHPVIRGMAADGIAYCGVLYVGLMIDPSGAPRVVEFNVRFGDPETQALVVRMEGDLVPLLDGAARGRLDRAPPLGWQDAAVCVTGRCIPRERFNNLLGRPLGGGVFGHIEVHDPSALMSQHNEDEEHAALNGWHSEEITGDDIFNMVGQKGPPRGGRWLSDAGSVRLHRRFRHGDAQLAEFAHNAR
jgi:hypothetical protein